MAIAIESIEDSDELVAALRSVDISVPLRTEGRTTHHCETRAICRLLSTLNHAQRLSFPFSVHHRDRPDFLAATRENQIGVEVTEAIPEQWASFVALAEKEFPDAAIPLEPGHFSRGAPRLSLAAMRNLLGQPQGRAKRPWIGDRPEREWALCIQGVVDAKLTKLASPEFKKFDLNWLSIYDNVPLPSIHLEKGIEFLSSLLQDRWLRNPSFDTIFIEHGLVIAEISLAESHQLVLRDLWG